MMSATDNEIMGLRSELITQPKTELAVQPPVEEIEEQRGFLGTFNEK